MMKNTTLDSKLASTITKAASRQTYYTIRLLADRELVPDAYRAYAYFRWVDDTLDNLDGSTSERKDFIRRQKSLLEGCYLGNPPIRVNPNEQMLVELIQNDRQKNSGLQAYLRNMMAVMVFDADRRGRLICQSELNEYTSWLATAVTEAMHFFIGRRDGSPRNPTRYLAVTGAHITHMLRDTVDDLQAGYYNIPIEVLEAHHITPQDIHSRPYRAWVRSRVKLARTCFQSGRAYLYQVENLRCRLAGLAYLARFEKVLTIIEQDDYDLRAVYPEQKGLSAIVRAGASLITSVIVPGRIQVTS
jgi:phytoene/squalene synthetase